MPALSAMSSVEVAGACDLDASRRERAQARWPVPVFSRFDEMLEQAKPDVVIVATPPEHHVDACLQALAAGAHVVCEKPFATTIADGRRILDAATAANRRVALNHEFREMRIGAAIRERIGAPGVGPLHFAHIWQAMDLPPWKEPGWRGTWSRGVLFEAGIHLMDYALALYNDRPLSVSATMSTCGVRDEHTDSVALVTLEFSRGRIAQVMQNRLSAGDTRYFEVSADCAEATLRGSFGGRARISAGLVRSTVPHVRMEYGAAGIAWEERGPKRRTICQNPKEPGMEATSQLLAKTFAGFANGGDVPASGAVGLMGLEVLAACYLSAETGQRVRLDAESLAPLLHVPIGR